MCEATEIWSCLLLQRMPNPIVTPKRSLGDMCNCWDVCAIATMGNGNKMRTVIPQQGELSLFLFFSFFHLGWKDTKKNLYLFHYST